MNAHKPTGRHGKPGERRLLVPVTTLSLALALAGSGCAGPSPKPVAGRPNRALHAGTPTPVTGASGGLPTAPTLAGDIPIAGVLAGILPRAGVRTVAPAPGPLPKCQAFTLTAALFDGNSASLRTDATEALTSVARQLQSGRGPVTIVGYTDSRPTSYPGGNQGLSEARAKSVRDALTGRGVAAIVDVEGRGDQEPVDLGTSDAAYSRNRRVEVSVNCGTPQGANTTANPA